VARPKTKIDQVVSQARNLIECLRAEAVAPQKPRTVNREAPKEVFVHQPLGGIALFGREAEMFRDCVDAMAGVHAGNPELRVLSRKACEELLWMTVLRAIRVRTVADRMAAAVDASAGRRAPRRR
jgi:hypothetical protein